MADEPDKPFCNECDEIDLEVVKENINEWMRYLADREAYLKEKKGE
jgi:hypothetical protein